MITRRTPRLLLSALVIALGASTLSSVSTAAEPTPRPPAAETGRAAMPTKAQWVEDVKQVMAGSRGWLDKRVTINNRRDTPRKLALNLDIDNSAIASYYDFPHATPYVVRLARRAHSKGVALLFNTARLGDQLAAARSLLVNAGYTVDSLCGRSSSKTGIAAGKKACRAKFRKAGYTLIGNIGNRPTDFEGGGYWRAFRLPNYDMRLG